MADDPNKLTRAEQRLIERVAKGTQWVPETYRKAGKLDDLIPANAEHWHKDRHIRAEVIRYLALEEIWPGEEKPWPVHAKGIQISSARITGRLDCEGATIKHTLWLHHCSFDQAPVFRHAQTKTLSFAGSHLPGLNCNGVKVDGSVLLRNGFTVQSEANFIAANIDGDFDASGGHFNSKDKVALNANGITARIAFVCSGFTAMGEVNFVAARINVDFDATNGHFTNNHGCALAARGAIVGRHVILRDGFTATGEVDFRAAIVTGHILCRGGIFDAQNKNALSLRFAKIGSAVQLEGGKSTRDEKDYPPAKFNGYVDLRQAQCRTYSDAPEAWPEAGNLLLDGFTYERFDDCPIDWDARRQWLERQPPEHLGRTSETKAKPGWRQRIANIWKRRAEPEISAEPEKPVEPENPVEPESATKPYFRPQPWVQACKVLRDMGHDFDARELGLHRERLRTRSADLSWRQRWWLKLLFKTTGSGYRPTRALWWSAGIVGIGWLVFAAAGNLGYMAPHEAAIKTYVATPGNESLPPQQTRFNALVYSLDTYLPVIELGQNTAWEPVNEPHSSVPRLANGDGWPTCLGRLALGRNSQWQILAANHQRSCGFAADQSLLSWFTGVGEWAFRSGFHRFAHWALDILGWIGISLFIAGMSGVMKKE